MQTTLRTPRALVVSWTDLAAPHYVSAGKAALFEGSSATTARQAANKMWLAGILLVAEEIDR
jgi:hypothetical protein